MFITVHFKQRRQSTGDEAWVARRVRVDAISDFYDEKSAVLCFNEGTLAVRETPAEIMALVAAEERKQQRLILAGQIVPGLLTNLTYTADAGYAPEVAGRAVIYADALLAALDARDGE